MPSVACRRAIWAGTRPAPTELLMTYRPELHHRRSIRLKGYDYGQTGAYFVTICAQGRACLFGAIDAGEMQLNDAGKMGEAVWLQMPERFPGDCIG